MYEKKGVEPIPRCRILPEFRPLVLAQFRWWAPPRPSAMPQCPAKISPTHDVLVNLQVLKFHEPAHSARSWLSLHIKGRGCTKPAHLWILGRVLRPAKLDGCARCHHLRGRSFDAFVATWSIAHEAMQEMRLRIRHCKKDLKPKGQRGRHSSLVKS